jgi:hypothetical protein
LRRLVLVIASESEAIHPFAKRDGFVASLLAITAPGQVYG